MRSKRVVSSSSRFVDHESTNFVCGDFFFFHETAVRVTDCKNINLLDCLDVRFIALRRRGRVNCSESDYTGWIVARLPRACSTGRVSWLWPRGTMGKCEQSRLLLSPLIKAFDTHGTCNFDIVWLIFTYPPGSGFQIHAGLHGVKRQESSYVAIIDFFCIQF